MQSIINYIIVFHCLYIYINDQKTIIDAIIINENMSKNCFES
jgi:hypothetical protein